MPQPLPSREGATAKEKKPDRGISLKERKQ